MVSKELCSTAEATLACLFSPQWTTGPSVKLLRFRSEPLKAFQALLIITLQPTPLKDQRSPSCLTKTKTLCPSETSGSGWLQLLVCAHAYATIRPDVKIVSRKLQMFLFLRVTHHREMMEDAFWKQNALWSTIKFRLFMLHPYGAWGHATSLWVCCYSTNSAETPSVCRKHHWAFILNGWTWIFTTVIPFMTQTRPLLHCLTHFIK